jgi:hypothetical protein
MLDTPTVTKQNLGFKINYLELWETLPYFVLVAA